MTPRLGDPGAVVLGVFVVAAALGIAWLFARSPERPATVETPMWTFVVEDGRLVSCTATWPDGHVDQCDPGFSGITGLPPSSKLSR